MKNEFIEGIAKMHSLMERMDRHMTLDQAQYNRENHLCEAIATNSGKLEPNVFMTIDEDSNNRTRVLKVFLGPLFKPDANMLSNAFGANSDAKTINGKTMTGVIFKRSLPYKKFSRGSKGGASANNAAPAATNNPTQGATQPDPSAQVAPQSPAKKTLGAMLMAKKNGGVVTEALKDILAAKKAAAQAQANGGQATPANNTTPAAATNNPAQAAPASTNAIDEKVQDWLTKTIVAAAQKLTKNPNYDKASLDNLMDINYLMSKYLVAPEKSDINYVEETSEEIKKSIQEAIKNNDWSALAGVFNPINLQAIIFGNVLSDKNNSIIRRQAADYGLSPTDPDYPSNVYAPNKWITKFGRRVLPTASRKYRIVSPKMNDRGTKVNLGSKGHYDEFGTQLKGFQPIYVYDIKDTERIPADEYDKYGLDPTKLDPNVDYHNDIPGLANNLTGELNPHAIKHRDDAMAERESSLTQQQKDLLKATETDDGKAKIYNDALIHYAEKNGMTGSVNLVDVNNSPKSVMDYAKNVIAICGLILQKLRYANPNLVEPLKSISAFAICCKTVGAKEVLAISSSSANNTKQLLTDWENASTIMLQSVTNIINFVVDYLIDKYSRFGDDGGNATQFAAAANAPATTVATNNPTTAVNENKNKKKVNIEFLLEELLK